jgi:hypothetical protein
MEYKEAPSIYQVERRLNFSTITWLDKAKFEEYLNSGREIYPNSLQYESTDKIYIGKTIPLVESERYWPPPNGDSLEIIGTVFKNINGEWQLNVSHGSAVKQINGNFLVLSIEDPNSFEWVRTTDANLPKYALRGSIVQDVDEYFYIGKTIPTEIQTESQTISYYRNEEIQFNEPIPCIY